jgi:hypothetical protein
MKWLAMSCAVPLMVAGGSARAFAQANPNLDLYHVHFVKAAPGKLAALIDLTLEPPPDPDKGNEPPIVFRHVQGDDWHLLVLTPYGKEETIRAEAPGEADRQYLAQLRNVSLRHDDTIAQGPAWAEAKKVLLGDGQPGAVWIVTAFESVPGHRDQLVTAITQGPNANPSAQLVLQHREGAAWQVLTLTRYASWAALADAMQKQRAQGTAPPPTAEHAMGHHDTIVERVTGPAR